MSLHNTTVVLGNNSVSDLPLIHRSETIKNLLLDKEELVKTTYYGLMKHAKQAGLLDKTERLYFVGDNYTINLIPQALLVRAGFSSSSLYSYVWL